jgi:soluble lytic murein transglycosylase-like protein
MNCRKNIQQFLEKHVGRKMKPIRDKKLTIQLLTVGCLRFIFIAVIVLGVTLAANHNDQKVINPQGLKKAHLTFKTEHRLPSLSGRKAEHLYHMFIIETASHHQIDPALIKAIIMAESGYNPRAISKRGAKGLIQLMPGTAQSLGVEDTFNPHQNITGGIQYFKQMVNRFNGDIKLALAAYNAGSRNVRNYNGVPPFKATHSYIKKVFKYYQIYKDQMANEIDRV